MTLNASGPISLAGTTAGVSIEIENGGSGTTQISLNDTAVRNLAGVPSGAIIMPTNFYGKSNRVAISYTFSASTANVSLNVASISGYVAGITGITVTVNSGVYLYATSTGNAGLTLTGGTTGDTLTLVNNGYIMGQGGSGGNPAASSVFTGYPSSGGPALSLGFNTTVNTVTGYIGGGGGGGGLYYAISGGIVGGGGGGGAGGGNGGGSTSTAGGAGGGIGSAGANSSTWNNTGTATAATGGGAGGGGSAIVATPRGGNNYTAGAGGGRIFPGTGGTGGVTGTSVVTGGAGGAANATGGNGSNSGSSSYGGGAGGGGGWGAAGGVAANTPTTPATFTVVAPGSGGHAVSLNGKTITWSGSTANVYGAVV